MKKLTHQEKDILLKLARQSIEAAVQRQPKPLIELEKYTSRLQQDGASFVTLTIHESLRGCIGALETYQPLVQDVCEHAEAAALEDYRFPRVRPLELDHIQIEISVLTPPASLVYKTPEELLQALKPGVDGVILRVGERRATFLPQVWEQLPDPKTFLSHLCQKMGASSDLWRKKELQVSIYQVEEFRESKKRPSIH